MYFFGKVKKFNCLGLNKIRNKLLAKWDSTVKEYQKEKCIHELFEEQVKKDATAIAVIYEDTQLSYDELNKRANKLAHFLVRERQIKPDTLIGVCVERSLDMVVAVLGVLKAGGAYVPLDPDYPNARLTFMLRDSNVNTVLTQRHLLNRLSVSTDYSVCMDDELIQQKLEGESTENLRAEELGLRSAHLAYVIYTSGSTGNPKGSLLEHRGLCNLTHAQRQGFNIQPDSRVLQFASNAFDAAVSELMVTLCSGAKLIIVPSLTIKNLPLLEATIKNKKITHATLPPALLPLLNLSEWRCVHTMIIAGDTCNINVANQWAVGRHLINAYGPSEATVCSTMGIYQPGQSHLHIGKPLQNVQAYIFDENGEIILGSEPGELHIGGIGLARGYLNRPALTAEKFIANPFYDKDSPNSSERLYKTGDLVRKLPDGNMEFLGRMDNQVKIRGFRIELGEIENTLVTHEKIKDAIVAVKESADGDKRLIAYLVTRYLAENKTQRDTTSMIESLRLHIARTLPSYMVPSAFVFLEHLPLTPNGKVDRKALPDPDFSSQKHGYVAPFTEAEKRLCKIWEEVLNVKRVGIWDNFFLLGGDSLRSIKLLAEMRIAGIDILTKELAQFPSIASILNFLETREVKTYEYAEGNEIHSIPNRQLLFKTAYNNHWNLDGIINIKNVDILLLETALKTMILRHQGLRHLFYINNGIVGERVAEIEGGQLLEVIDLSALDSQQSRSKEIEKISSQIQSSFDLTRNLYKFLLFLCGNDEPARFVWIIHHSLMDGYGADIFFQELLNLYLSLVAKVDYRFAGKTTSVLEWGNLLYHYINSDHIKEDVGYWTALKYEKARTLMDYPDGLGKNRSYDKTLYGRHLMVTKRLSERNSLLLQEDQWKHDGITSAGIIFFSFSYAISVLTKSEYAYFEIMTHGRHKIIHGVDLSRTVGWLMDNVPVFVKVIDGLSLTESVKSYNDQYNRIPNFGLSFNGLKYLSSNTETRAAFSATPTAEFSINYVPPKISSQIHNFFDAEASRDLPLHLLSLGTEFLGVPYNVEDKEILWPTHIQIQMKEGQYTFMWFTRDNIYKKETIESAMALWIETIEAILTNVEG